MVILTNIWLPGAKNNLSSGSSLNKVCLGLRICDSVNILSDILQYLGYFHPNLALTYSIYKCIHIHGLRVNWCQIIFSGNIFYIIGISFPESNQESEIELISLHYSSVPRTFLLMFSIIQALKLLRTSDLPKHWNFFIDHKR